MTQTSPDQPVRYMRTPEAAKLLGLSIHTMEKHRCYGTGPAFIKLGGRVVYKPDDLRTWAEQGVRTSTHQATATTVRPARRHPDTPAGL